ncbi:TPA: hypothetical protein NY293_005210 [Escherichia coli]|uniref:Uncharacterized protein n=1 Tax=Escherichia coli TaxID=562 RepID=A0A827EYS4_ECOLX|nr:hypothetical protein [Escherichia coli]EFA4158461.1 hypothetical protein [Escherichia coli O174:H7]EFE9630442.1 hypothetical protein [Escherichia coli]EFM0187151.1 hypothetical protein [Escherichia coli]EFM6347594.1 hypothetical protein [Escherichia coli]EFM6563257.1 hypothetical protein [Escherichia coli]
MPYLSVMLVITVFVASFMLARFAVYHFLVWLKPSKTLKFTYIDRGGVKHFCEVRLDAGDARELAATLSEVQRDLTRGSS